MKKLSTTTITKITVMLALLMYASCKDYPSTACFREYCTLPTLPKSSTIQENERLFHQLENTDCDLSWDQGKIFALALLNEKSSDSEVLRVLEFLRSKMSTHFNSVQATLKVDIFKMNPKKNILIDSVK